MNRTIISVEIQGHRGKKANQFSINLKFIF